MIGSITAKQLREKLKNKGFTLLDVRTKEEYDDFHIDGSILLPYDQIPARHNEIPDDKPIICICRSGHRSMIACRMLEKLGFKQLTNVEDGILGWAVR